MKTNYYELQVFVEGSDYRTIFAYVGTRSNANRKFRHFLHHVSFAYSVLSYRFRVRTFSSVRTYLSGDSVCTTPFYP